MKEVNVIGLGVFILVSLSTHAEYDWSWIREAVEAKTAYEILSKTISFDASGTKELIRRAQSYMDTESINNIVQCFSKHTFAAIDNTVLGCLPNSPHIKLRSLIEQAQRGNTFIHLIRALWMQRQLGL